MLTHILQKALENKFLFYLEGVGRYTYYNVSFEGLLVLFFYLWKYY